MRTAQPDKRTRLIETATKLAYGRGFRETSLADIAEAARVPVGNVYYYFKTKEELAEAVVERRLEEFRAARAEWDRLSSPKERLFAFVDSVHAQPGATCARRMPSWRAVHGVAQGGRRSREEIRGALQLSPCVGLRSSSGPLAMKRIHENSRSISSPPFRVWRLLRSAPTTARWW